MGYVKLGEMEMEWFSEKEYQECLFIFADFKNIASKSWELEVTKEGLYEAGCTDKKKRHSGSEGTFAR